MLRACCWVLSLQIGCYMVAGFFLLVQFVDIYNYASLLPFLGPDEREDKENEETRERVKIKHIVWVVFISLFCFIGIAIIVATYLKRPLMLKVLAVVVLAPSLVMLIKLPFEGRPSNLITLFSRMISLGIFVYCAVVLWSFAKEIEDPDVELAVYVDPSYWNYQQPDPGQQLSQQQLQNRDQVFNYPYPYPQSNQPYTFWGRPPNHLNQGVTPPQYYYHPQPNYYYPPEQPNTPNPTQPSR